MEVDAPLGSAAAAAVATAVVEVPPAETPEQKAACEAANAAALTEACDLIRRWRFSHEHVGDSVLLHMPEVWRAFLDVGMPMTALVRNLGRMSSLGVLDSAPHLAAAVAQLGSEAAVRAARLHPITLLEAMRVYSGGCGEKGSLRWTPTQAMTDALEAAFYLAFKNVEPTGLRFLAAVDVSGSMSGATVAGMKSLSAREAAGAMLMALLRAESDVHAMAFSGGFVKLDVQRDQKLGEVCSTMSRMPFQGTDCSLPMKYALEAGLKVDVFVVMTDNETYSGSVHPTEMLKRYRTATGIDAKLVVLAFSATSFTIADPADPGMLDIAGLDSAVPRIIHEFCTGKLLA